MNHQNKPCPACGGTDRFYYIAAPHDESAPYWRCRQCDYTEPGDEDGESPDGGEHQQRRLTPEETAEAHHAYTAVALACAERLWKPEGANALAYLRKRGLSDSMIRGARLGWCGDGMELFTHLWYTDRRAYDGALTGGLRKLQGVPKPLLRRAITIPYWQGETCALLRTRLYSPQPGQPKYLSPSGPHYAGGAPSFYLHHVLDGQPSVILTEGEIKALVAHQEWRAGRNPLPCVATAGALYLPDALVQALAGKTVYLAYDNEKPKRGERESAGEKAIVRNGNKLRKAGIAVKVIELPRGDEDKVDLDSYILATREAAVLA